MTIYEFDFPCGCHTDKFDPREWHLCNQHETDQDAILSWAAEGAKLYRAIFDLPPVVALRERLNAQFLGRERMEGLPEETIPRVY